MRRYAPIAASRGTVIPASLRLRVLTRDNGCVGFGRFPVECAGGLELDHVRASGGMGMKSRTAEDNLVALCGACHRWSYDVVCERRADGANGYRIRERQRVTTGVPVELGL